VKKLVREGLLPVPFSHLLHIPWQRF